MKQFLKSMFCIGLFLSGLAFTFSLSSNCNSNSSDCANNNRDSNNSSNNCITNSSGCGNRVSNDCTSYGSGSNSNDTSNDCASSRSSCYDNGSSNDAISSSNECSNSCSDTCSESYISGSSDYGNDSYCNNCSGSSCGCSSDTCGCSCSSDDCASCTNASVRTYYHIRSQGANTARELVGWQWDLNLPWMCCNYGAAYIAYEYQRSFDGCRIANSYFGGKKLYFAGSLVPNRTNRDLLADNFGLSRTFQGTITFNPAIQNHIIDLGYYLGLDVWLQGSYIRLHFPITYSFWTLNARETIINLGSKTESSCYYGSDDVETSPIAVPYLAIPATTVATSLRQALSGTFLFGDMQTPWCAGRFNLCGRGKWALADIDLLFGYNFIITDCYHFGAYLLLVLNTPPKPKDFFVFSPVVGNGGHFELGAGISAHWSLWSDEEQNLAVFLEGNITHMFNNEQCRLFDFCHGGPFSRYMLLKEYDTNGLIYTYNGSLISATCFANQKVNVKVNIKGDLSVKLAYRFCNWGFDVGYNIYGHSHETIETKCYEENCAPVRILSPKGTSSVCCASYPIVCLPTVVADDTFYNSTIYPNGAVIPSDAVTCSMSTGACPPENATNTTPFTGQYIVTAVPNNGSQPLATAYSGYPVVSPVLGAPTTCSIVLSPDNTKEVPDTGQTFTTLSDLVADGYTLCDSIPLSVPLTRRDLNKISAQAVSQMTNKIFGFVSYTYFDVQGWNPQVGVGAEVEWNQRKNSEICKKTDLQQWGVWFKASLAY